MNHRVLGTGTLLGLVAAVALGGGAFACSDSGGSGGGAGSGGFAGTPGTAGSGGDAGSGGGTAGSGGGTGECAGVTCLVEGETCIAGKCTCTEDSCPVSFVCNAAGLCEASGCTPACESGEVCIYDPTSTKFKCVCNPTDDRCPEGQQCDSKTDRCVIDTPCDPECTPGETCDEVTKTCKCGPGTCDDGYQCKAGRCVPTPPEEGEPCNPDLPDSSADFDCVPLSGGRSEWMRSCTTSAQCNDPQRYCAAPAQPYCVPNVCDSGALDGQGKAINGTNFGPCDADDGVWAQGDPATGTCIPLPATGGGNVSLCVRAGNVEPGGACAQIPRAAGPNILCEYDAWCVGEQLEGCVEDSECAPGGECVAGVCREDCFMGNCRPPYRCDKGLCIEKCMNNSDCRAGAQCTDGQCVPKTCSSDAACGGGAYCTDDGICTPVGTCEDACNAGSSGTGMNDADCEDPAGQCVSAVPNGGGAAVSIGYCRAFCDTFDPTACPTFDGSNRYCRPLRFDDDDPTVPGICQAQVNNPTDVGLACSPKDAPGTANVCVDRALCVGDQPPRCRNMCWCGAEFDQDGNCAQTAPQCTAFDSCRGAPGNTVGFCLP